MCIGRAYCCAGGAGGKFPEVSCTEDFKITTGAVECLDFRAEGILSETVGSELLGAPGDSE